MQRLTPNSRGWETKCKTPILPLLLENEQAASSFLAPQLPEAGAAEPRAHAATSGQVPEHGRAERPAE